MTIAVIPIPGLPMVRPGDDLAALLGDAIAEARVGLKARDVVAVCQKVVSKAEGSVVALDDVVASSFAEKLAAQTEGGKDPRAMEVVGQAQRWGKPIVFGEVGYEASSYAGENPCCNSTKSASDVYVQSRAYQALLDTFASQPWWGGVNWWAWNNGDPRSPEGKPAEGLIGARSVAFPLVVAPGGGGSATATSLPSIL